MNKLIVKYHEGGVAGHVNTPCDRLREESGILYAYRGEELIGTFDLGAVDMAYLSEGKT